MLINCEMFGRVAPKMVQSSANGNFYFLSPSWFKALSEKPMQTCLQLLKIPFSKQQQHGSVPLFPGWPLSPSPWGPSGTPPPSASTSTTWPTSSPRHQRRSHRARFQRRPTTAWAAATGRKVMTSRPPASWTCSNTCSPSSCCGRWRCCQSCPSSSCPWGEPSSRTSRVGRPSTFSISN